MPTAAKLAAALLFAALAWIVSRLTFPLWPEGADPGRFAEINAAVGLVLGWRMAGARAGTGWTSGIGHGLTTAVAVAFVSLFLHSFAEMIRQSLRKFYDGPMEAVVAVFGLLVEQGARLGSPQTVGVLLAGGAAAGLVTAWCGRHFR
ncbi:TrgA family protein [Rubellimicrobium sp. CFH 75288]|uniref:TrgA family protein n=1 Tax=Rubellimicrobium sp. CFH 75288 TaxID=2697034 RepID=UPI00141203DE|nr:TrgA family protein [Rubellimicrobium sp. CFH 75288]NAZ36263.1 TrgA family protein [Rubellimicrobium sp. CFH 75288]